jgi:hypothetical protein
MIRVPNVLLARATMKVAPTKTSILKGEDEFDRSWSNP